MHSHLVQEKEIVCREFIEALNACHANWLKKYTGGCNDEKTRLNSCLRQERMDRTTRHREEAKRKKQVVDENMRKWKEDA
ncbi:hypothetical protein M408DRAFT_332216 [Serendipita vermifera MAFF 305830]|uniref:COX assembly mitochondrial protein n=1 Tax=Serendipita vermifera MAFF 305830 TaxID=933852 RepID=A0A0C3AUL8_SERVB|nr:hypothetical protein M408DRAFT_332216 [Serendipita vermifera MAFF 305830]